MHGNHPTRYGRMGKLLGFKVWGEISVCRRRVQCGFTEDENKQYKQSQGIRSRIKNKWCISFIFLLMKRN